MATRSLMALEYSDMHTNNVLRKHAKKRPLGELETRYQYTPPQPVLSCRTVDIDVCGTRTYRPRSTTDILTEQQKLIHKLFRNGRTVTSAPPRRTPRKGLGVVNDSVSATQHKAKIHVQGRPWTSKSPHVSPEPGRQKPTSSGQRPRTTGRLKNVRSATDSFMVLTKDDDMLRTSRSHAELTNQIHAHWRPDSSKLNQGHFMRGQKRPDDVPPTLDAWLTFGGTAGEEAGGVLDAFANLQSPEDYYNIEGSVGSRVAQQLQKGDRIRIGVNGDVLSHDLKVKKWVKGEQFPPPTTPGGGDEGGADRKESFQGRQEEGTEEEEEEGGMDEEGEDGGGGGSSAPQSARDKPSENGEDMFGELMFESLENIVEEVSPGTPRKGEAAAAVRRSRPVVDFPLSWDDQVNKPQVKVITARPTPRDNNTENLCETHPVLFNRVDRTPNPRPKLASQAYISNGYRIKQRNLSNSNSNNGSNNVISNPANPADGVTHHHHHRDNAGGKVKAISFDDNSPEDDERLNSMSVDDVIQSRLEKNGSSSDFPGMPSSARSSNKSRSSNKKGKERNGERYEEDSTKHNRGGGGGKENGSRGGQQQRSVSAVSGRSRGGGESHSLGERGGSGRARAPLAVPRPSSSVPLLGTNKDLHLSVVTPKVSARSRQAAELGARSAQPLGRVLPMRSQPLGPQHLGGGGVSSINAGPIPGDTEFIQISQPLRNPQTSLASVSSRGDAGGAGGGGVSRGAYSPYPMDSSGGSTPLPPRSPLRSNTPDDGVGGGGGDGCGNSADTSRTTTPTQEQQQVAAGRNGGSSGINTTNINSNTIATNTPTAAYTSQNGSGSGGVGGGGGGSSSEDPQQQNVSGVSTAGSAAEEGSGGGGSRKNTITNPTSDAASAASSTAAGGQSTSSGSVVGVGVMAISIPTGDHLDDDDDDDLTGAQRRERTMRDQQIEHITSLLGDAILIAKE